MIAPLVLVWACEAPDQATDNQVMVPETLWTRTFGGTQSDAGYSVQKTDDGGFVVAGHTHVGAASDDIYLIRTDDDGNTL